MPADASVGSAQKILQLGGLAKRYANPVVELSVDDCETMLGQSSSRDLLQDQLAVVPAAIRRLWRIAIGVEEPPEDRYFGSLRSPLGLVDHEHAMSRKFCVIGSDLPVVLQHDLITNIELEDDHRSRRGGRSRWSGSVLLDTCPVAEHGKEEFAKFHTPILS
jgi:hypothetical protein